MEKKGKNKETLPMFVIYLQQHVHIQKEKKKGVLVKSTAQLNPKFSLSKCVASWTRNNYTYKDLFPLGCCDLKIYPNRNFLFHLFHLVHNHFRTLQIKHEPNATMNQPKNH